MKRLGGLLLVSIFAGAITLGAYKLFFEDNTYKWVATGEETPLISTSALTTSAKGAGINEVDFTIAAEKTVNAVVHVKNLSVSKGNSGSLADFFYGFERQQTPQIGTGSGVIISPDGYIVTNNHVIDNATQLEVTLNNKKTYDAEVIGTDSNSDIALLKIDVDNPLPYLAFGNSDNARVGEWVLAVGNPFSLTSTVTAGIVSAKARSLGRNQSFIQTDAAVNPGNSGGALVNTNGDLIGINTAITSQTGSYVGYAFAVPSNIAKKVVEDIMEFGNVQRGLLGISAANVNSRAAIEMGLNEIEGVYVSQVSEDSGAADAGLQEGDIIKQVDNIKVRKFSELTGYLSSKRPGDTIEVTVDREGRRLVKSVTLKKQNSIILPNTGFMVKNLSDADKKKFGVKNGVKIIDVPEGYGRYDLENKVIIALDDNEINNIDDAREHFGEISRYGRTSFTMINEKGEKERLILQ
ncbi:trypsin-like peptidase domain-containing protein [Muricauda sp. 2012CJ35-5]|uniref:Trypsin-like peptidase domain-containing protein n=1 Tax=Flagellimonas spongiicola TaxID=2942208 RepID=A0ABT0PNU9_9FLAO|nr:trypsin-like peptidase domain-containing protein [Allomuricauda spongiicola]MCL6273062.1 trypsin-like peptidase domain-containing protein [Allomuricauda spongiicola]